MKIKIEIDDDKACVWMEAINSMVETRYVGDDDIAVLFDVTLAISDANNKAVQEMIDSKPTMEELLACETFEPERIDYNGSWGRDPQ